MKSLIDEFNNYNINVISGDYLGPFRDILYKYNNFEIKTKLYTDYGLFNSDSIHCEFPIGMLLEAREVIPDVYSWIEKNYMKFEIIFTHEKKLLNLSKKFIFYPFGGCWIKDKDRQIYKKTLIASIIASGKCQTSGHRLRHSVIQNFKDRLDGIYGHGYNSVENKVEALDKFMYSVVIENSKIDFWFTEKIIDCFATGTIPIYWGCPSVGAFFDPNGIIHFNDETQLESIMTCIGKEDYYNRLEAIIYNFNKVANYATRRF